MIGTELEGLIRVRRMASTGEARALRLRAGLSLSEVADACGVAVMTVHRWEVGKRRPTDRAAALRYLAVIELIDKTTPQAA